MEPKLGILKRYSNNHSDNNIKLIEHPTKISKKRVFEHAYMLVEGNGASPSYSFSEALKEAWKLEKNLIKSSGFIYLPYMII